MHSSPLPEPGLPKRPEMLASEGAAAGAAELSALLCREDYRLAEPGEQKRMLRAQLRSWRRAVSPAQRARAGEIISRRALEMLRDLHVELLGGSTRAGASQAGPLTVAAFVPTPTEPDISPLLAGLVQGGLRVLVPAGNSLPEGETSPWKYYAGPGAAPTTDCAPSISRASLIFLPGLAADSHGTRLGQGGGWYDRALASLPAPGKNAGGRSVGGPPRVEICYDWEYLASPQLALPRQAHDLPLSAVLTPGGLHLIEDIHS